MEKKVFKAYVKGIVSFLKDFYYRTVSLSVILGLLLPALLHTTVFAAENLELDKFNSELMDVYFKIADKFDDEKQWRDIIESRLNILQANWEEKALQKIDEKIEQEKSEHSDVDTTQLSERYQQQLQSAKAEWETDAQNVVHAEYGRWLFKRAALDWRDVDRNELYTAIEEADKLYLYETSNDGEYIYDEEGYRKIRSIETIDYTRDFLLWDEKVLGVVNSDIDKYTTLLDSDINAYKNKTVDLALDQDALDAFLQKEKSLRMSAFEKERDYLYRKAKSRMRYTRLFDNRSLRKDSEEKAPDVIADKIIVATQTELDKEIEALQKILDAESPDGASSDLDKFNNVKISIENAFNSGMTKWQEAEENFISERILWEKNAVEVLKDGEAAWEEAFRKFKEAKDTWQITLDQMIAVGLNEWEKKETELSINFLEAKQDLNKYLEALKVEWESSGAELVNTINNSIGMLKQANENIEFFKKAIRNCSATGKTDLIDSYKDALDKWIEYRNQFAAMIYTANEEYGSLVDKNVKGENNFLPHELGDSDYTTLLSQINNSVINYYKVDRIPETLMISDKLDALSGADKNVIQNMLNQYYTYGGANGAYKLKSGISLSNDEKFMVYYNLYKYDMGIAIDCRPDRTVFPKSVNYDDLAVKIGLENQKNADEAITYETYYLIDQMPGTLTVPVDKQAGVSAVVLGLLSKYYDQAGDLFIQKTVTDASTGEEISMQIANEDKHTILYGLKHIIDINAITCTLDETALHSRVAYEDIYDKIVWKTTANDLLTTYYEEAGGTYTLTGTIAGDDKLALLEVFDGAGYSGYRHDNDLLENYKESGILTDYDVELIKVRGMLDYWEDRLAVIDEVISYSKDLSSEKDTKEKTEIAYQEAEAQFIEAKKYYEARLSELRILAKELESIKDELAMQSDKVTEAQAKFEISKKNYLNIYEALKVQETGIEAALSPLHTHYCALLAALKKSRESKAQYYTLLLEKNKIDVIGKHYEDVTLLIRGDEANNRVGLDTYRRVKAGFDTPLLNYSFTPTGELEFDAIKSSLMPIIKEVFTACTGTDESNYFNNASLQAYIEDNSFDEAANKLDEPWYINDSLDTTVHKQTRNSALYFIKCLRNLYRTSISKADLEDDYQHEVVKSFFELEKSYRNLNDLVNKDYDVMYTQVKQMLGVEKTDADYYGKTYWQDITVTHELWDVVERELLGDNATDEDRVKYEEEIKAAIKELELRYTYNKNRLQSSVAVINDFQTYPNKRVQVVPDLAFDSVVATLIDTHAVSDDMLTQILAYYQGLTLDDQLSLDELTALNAGTFINVNSDALITQYYTAVYQPDNDGDPTTNGPLLHYQLNPGVVGELDKITVYRQLQTYGYDTSTLSYTITNNNAAYAGDVWNVLKTAGYVSEYGNYREIYTQLKQRFETAYTAYQKGTLSLTEVEKAKAVLDIYARYFERYESVHYFDLCLIGEETLGADDKTDVEESLRIYTGLLDYNQAGGITLSEADINAMSAEVKGYYDILTDETVALTTKDEIAAIILDEKRYWYNVLADDTISYTKYTDEERSDIRANLDDMLFDYLASIDMLANQELANLDMILAYLDTENAGYYLDEYRYYNALAGVDDATNDGAKTAIEERINYIGQTDNYCSAFIDEDRTFGYLEDKSVYLNKADMLSGIIEGKFNANNQALFKYRTLAQTDIFKSLSDALTGTNSVKELKYWLDNYFDSHNQELTPELENMLAAVRASYQNIALAESLIAGKDDIFNKEKMDLINEWELKHETLNTALTTFTGKYFGLSMIIGEITALEAEILNVDSGDQDARRSDSYNKNDFTGDNAHKLEAIMDQLYFSIKELETGETNLDANKINIIQVIDEVITYYTDLIDDATAIGVIEDSDIYNDLVTRRDEFVSLKNTIVATMNRLKEAYLINIGNNLTQLIINGMDATAEKTPAYYFNYLTDNAASISTIINDYLLNDRGIETDGLTADELTIIHNEIAFAFAGMYIDRAKDAYVFSEEQAHNAGDDAVLVTSVQDEVTKITTNFNLGAEEEDTLEKYVRSLLFNRVERELQALNYTSLSLDIQEFYYKQEIMTWLDDTYLNAADSTVFTADGLYDDFMTEFMDMPEYVTWSTIDNTSDAGINGVTLNGACWDRYENDLGEDILLIKNTEYNLGDVSDDSVLTGMGITIDYQNDLLVFDKADFTYNNATKNLELEIHVIDNGFGTVIREYARFDIDADLVDNEYIVKQASDYNMYELTSFLYTIVAEYVDKETLIYNKNNNKTTLNRELSDLNFDRAVFTSAASNYDALKMVGVDTVATVVSTDFEQYLVNNLVDVNGDNTTDDEAAFITTMYQETFEGDYAIADVAAVTVDDRDRLFDILTGCGYLEMIVDAMIATRQEALANHNQSLNAIKDEWDEKSSDYRYAAGARFFNTYCSRTVPDEYTDYALSYTAKMYSDIYNGYADYMNDESYYKNSNAYYHYRDKYNNDQNILTAKQAEIASHFTRVPASIDAGDNTLYNEYITYLINYYDRAISDYTDEITDLDAGIADLDVQISAATGADKDALMEQKAALEAEQAVLRDRIEAYTAYDAKLTLHENKLGTYRDAYTAITDEKRREVFTAKYLDASCGDELLYYLKRFALANRFEGDDLYVDNTALYNEFNLDAATLQALNEYSKAAYLYYNLYDMEGLVDFTDLLNWENLGDYGISVEQKADKAFGEKDERDRIIDIKENFFKDYNNPFTSLDYEYVVTTGGRYHDTVDGMAESYIYFKSGINNVIKGYTPLIARADEQVKIMQKKLEIVRENIFGDARGFLTYLTFDATGDENGITVQHDLNINSRWDEVYPDADKTDYYLDGLYTGVNEDDQFSYLDVINYFTKGSTIAGLEAFRDQKTVINEKTGEQIDYYVPVVITDGNEDQNHLAGRLLDLYNDFLQDLDVLKDMVDTVEANNTGDNVISGYLDYLNNNYDLLNDMGLHGVDTLFTTEFDQGMVKADKQGLTDFYYYYDDKDSDYSVKVMNTLQGIDESNGAPGEVVVEQRNGGLFKQYQQAQGEVISLKNLLNYNGSIVHLKSMNEEVVLEKLEEAQILMDDDKEALRLLKEGNFPVDAAPEAGQVEGLTHIQNRFDNKNTEYLDTWAGVREAYNEYMLKNKYYKVKKEIMEYAETSYVKVGTNASTGTLSQTDVGTNPLSNEEQQILEQNVLGMAMDLTSIRGRIKEKVRNTQYLYDRLFARYKEYNDRIHGLHNLVVSVAQSIAKEEFETEVLANLEDKQQEDMLSFYKLDATSGEYVLQDHVTTTERETIKKCFSLAEYDKGEVYTYEDLKEEYEEKTNRYNRILKAYNDLVAKQKILKEKERELRDRQLEVESDMLVDITYEDAASNTKGGDTLFEHTVMGTDDVAYSQADQGHFETILNGIGKGNFEKRILALLDDVDKELMLSVYRLDAADNKYKLFKPEGELTAEERAAIIRIFKSETGYYKYYYKSRFEKANRAKYVDFIRYIDGSSNAQLTRMLMQWGMEWTRENQYDFDDQMDNAFGVDRGLITDNWGAAFEIRDLRDKSFMLLGMEIPLYGIPVLSPAMFALTAGTDVTNYDSAPVVMTDLVLKADNNMNGSEKDWYQWFSRFYKGRNKGQDISTGMDNALKMNINKVKQIPYMYYGTSMVMLGALDIMFGIFWTVCSIAFGLSAVFNFAIPFGLGIPAGIGCYVAAMICGWAASLYFTKAGLELGYGIGALTKVINIANDNKNLAKQNEEIAKELKENAKKFCNLEDSLVVIRNELNKIDGNKTKKGMFDNLMSALDGPDTGINFNPLRKDENSEWNDTGFINGVLQEYDGRPDGDETVYSAIDMLEMAVKKAREQKDNAKNKFYGTVNTLQAEHEYKLKLYEKMKNSYISVGFNERESSELWLEAANVTTLDNVEDIKDVVDTTMYTDNTIPRSMLQTDFEHNVLAKLDNQADKDFVTSCYVLQDAQNNEPGENTSQEANGLYTIDADIINDDSQNGAQDAPTYTLTASLDKAALQRLSGILTVLGVIEDTGAGETAPADPGSDVDQNEYDAAANEQLLDHAVEYLFGDTGFDYSILLRDVMDMQEDLYADAQDTAQFGRAYLKNYSEYLGKMNEDTDPHSIPKVYENYAENNDNRYFYEMLIEDTYLGGNGYVDAAGNVSRSFVDQRLYEIQQYLNEIPAKIDRHKTTIIDNYQLPGVVYDDKLDETIDKLFPGLNAADKAEIKSLYKRQAGFKKVVSFVGSDGKTYYREYTMLNYKKRKVVGTKEIRTSNNSSNNKISLMSDNNHNNDTVTYQKIYKTVDAAKETITTYYYDENGVIVQVGNVVVNEYDAHQGKYVWETLDRARLMEITDLNEYERIGNYLDNASASDVYISMTNITESTKQIASLREIYNRLDIRKIVLTKIKRKLKSEISGVTACDTWQESDWQAFEGKMLQWAETETDEFDREYYVDYIKAMITHRMTLRDESFCRESLDEYKRVVDLGYRRKNIQQVKMQNNEWELKLHTFLAEKKEWMDKILAMKLRSESEWRNMAGKIRKQYRLWREDLSAQIDGKTQEWQDRYAEFLNEKKNWIALARTAAESRTESDVAAFLNYDIDAVLSDMKNEDGEWVSGLIGSPDAINDLVSEYTQNPLLQSVLNSVSWSSDKIKFVDTAMTVTEIKRNLTGRSKEIVEQFNTTIKDMSDELKRTANLKAYGSLLQMIVDFKKQVDKTNKDTDKNTFGKPLRRNDFRKRGNTWERPVIAGYSFTHWQNNCKDIEIQEIDNYNYYEIPTGLLEFDVIKSEKDLVTMNPDEVAILVKLEMENLRNDMQIIMPSIKSDRTENMFGGFEYKEEKGFKYEKYDNSINKHIGEIEGIPKVVDGTKMKYNGYGETERIMSRIATHNAMRSKYRQKSEGNFLQAFELWDSDADNDGETDKDNFSLSLSTMYTITTGFLGSMGGMIAGGANLGTSIGVNIGLAALNAGGQFLINTGTSAMEKGFATCGMSDADKAKIWGTFGVDVGINALSAGVSIGMSAIGEGITNGVANEALATTLKTVASESINFAAGTGLEELKAVGYAGVNAYSDSLAGKGNASQLFDQAMTDRYHNAEKWAMGNGLINRAVNTGFSVASSFAAFGISQGIKNSKRGLALQEAKAYTEEMEIYTNELRAYNQSEDMLGKFDYTIAKSDYLSGKFNNIIAKHEMAQSLLTGGLTLFANTGINQVKNLTNFGINAAFDNHFNGTTENAVGHFIKDQNTLMKDTAVGTINLFGNLGAQAISFGARNVTNRSKGWFAGALENRVNSINPDVIDRRNAVPGLYVSTLDIGARSGKYANFVGRTMESGLGYLNGFVTSGLNSLVSIGFDALLNEQVPGSVYYEKEREDGTKEKAFFSEDTVKSQLAELFAGQASGSVDMLLGMGRSAFDMGIDEVGSGSALMTKKQQTLFRNFMKGTIGDAYNWGAKELSLLINKGIMSGMTGDKAVWEEYDKRIDFTEDNDPFEDYWKGNIGQIADNISGLAGDLASVWTEKRMMNIFGDLGGYADKIDDIKKENLFQLDSGLDPKNEEHKAMIDQITATNQGFIDQLQKRNDRSYAWFNALSTLMTSAVRFGMTVPFYHHNTDKIGELAKAEASHVGESVKNVYLMMKKYYMPHMMELHPDLVDDPDDSPLKKASKTISKEVLFHIPHGEFLKYKWNDSQERIDTKKNQTAALDSYAAQLAAYYKQEEDKALADAEDEARSANLDRLTGVWNRLDIIDLKKEGKFKEAYELEAQSRRVEQEAGERRSKDEIKKLFEKDFVGGFGAYVGQIAEAEFGLLVEKAITPVFSGLAESLPEVLSDIPDNKKAGVALSHIRDAVGGMIFQGLPAYVDSPGTVGYVPNILTRVGFKMMKYPALNMNKVFGAKEMTKNDDGDANELYYKWMTNKYNNKTVSEIFDEIANHNFY